VRLVYAVPQHRNAALQGIAAMLSRVDSEHSLVRHVWHCLSQPGCQAASALVVCNLPLMLTGCAAYGESKPALESFAGPAGPCIE